MSKLAADTLRRLDTWTPIASRSREPIRRVRQEKDGATLSPGL